MGDSTARCYYYLIYCKGLEIIDVQGCVGEELRIIII